EVRERFGTLTTLFLNAGVSRPVALDACEEAAFDEVFAVNTKGQFFTLVKTLPLLSDGASIIVTVGIGATRSLTGNSLTAGSRGALLTMIPTLALELAPRRIRVNAVSPGFTDTPMMRTTPGMGSSEETSHRAPDLGLDQLTDDRDDALLSRHPPPPCYGIQPHPRLQRFANTAD